MASVSRPRAVLALLAVVAVGALVAFGVRSARVGGDPRVIVVGLDGADWQLLDTYMAAGKMPVLSQLVQEGRSGVLRAFQPSLSPLIWTTMMTGRSPLEHRILDFTRFHPVTGLREPITSDERQSKAVWEIVSDAGRDVAVFGLWATHPAEAVRGLMVSDRLFTFLRREDAPRGVVFPPDEEGRVLAARAQAEADVALGALQAYLPWLGAQEYADLVSRDNPYAHPATALRRVLVETRLYHRLALDWIRQKSPALSVVYIQGTDSIGHVFAAYAPPRQPEVSVDDFARYGSVAEAFFREIDTMLGEYRALAESIGASLVIVSDHGFLWNDGRPTRSDGLAGATAGLWHRVEGMYLLWGPGIEPNPSRGEGHVGQVTATLLALLDLPRAMGAEGPALAGIFEGDEVKDFGPRANRAAVQDSSPSREALEKLQALGYVSGNELGSRPESAGSSTRTPASFNNEGLLLKEAGRRREAQSAFEQALRIDPHSAPAQYNLAGLLELAGESDRADALLISAVGDGLGQGARRVEEIAVAALQRGDRPRAMRLLDGAIVHQPNDAGLRVMRGRLRIEGRDCPGAYEDFDAARRASPSLPVTHGLAGTALLCLGRPAEARSAFERSLALDPSQTRLRDLLARVQ